MNDTTPSILQQSLYELLLPLARLNLHYGLNAKEFIALSKKAYVMAAREDFGIRGRPTNKSRVATLTGLTRIEVQKLLEEAEDGQSIAVKSRPLQRIVSLWLREADFIDERGETRVISIDQGPISFTELAHRCGGDIPWQTLLKELIRLKIIEQDDANQLHLLQQGFLPQMDDQHKIPFLGEDVSALIQTISHNLRNDAEDLRFQRKVSFDQLSPEGVIALQTFAEQKGQALLLELDALLSQYALPGDAEKDNQDVDDNGRYAGLGMYVFESMKEPS
ncbi:MAG: hypothetical protein HRU20_07455 [Pseudomonadales bacterium]|nr:hypothetical protein [Pseudomonadales bacterium]